MNTSISHNSMEGIEMEHDDIRNYEGRIQDWVAQHNEDAIIYPDMDEALIGVCEQFGRPIVAAYDFNKCISILMEQGMEQEEALEYFYFNTLGLWAGESTPVFLTLYEE